MGVRIRVFRLAALTALLFPRATFAQLVRVNVREDGTGRRVAGAVVSLLGASDTVLIARFTNDSGVATLRAPVGGQYPLIVRRIGYRPRRTHVAVSISGTAELTLRLTPSPPIVATVIVQADSSCGDIPTEGADVFQLWESVRTALEANRLTESQRLVRMEIESYDRDLDRRFLERSKRVGSKIADTRQPFLAASPAELESRGYVTTTNGETFYFAPDARTLLSEEFVRSHCFFKRAGGRGERNLVGLAFKPKPGVSKPNISGVLWLDPKSFALKHLVFEYVNVPSSIPLEGVGGRLEFEQLRSGAWIIPRWYIRTPRLARVTRYISELSRPQTVDTLIGVRETGASARILGEHQPGDGNTDVLTVKSPADKSAPIGDALTAYPCADSSRTDKNTVFGTIRDAAGNAIPQAKLLLLWTVPELTNVGTSVLAGARGQSIEVDPDDRGSYAVCGLPTAVDYRVELRVAGRHVETRHVPAERSARRIEIHFTLAP
jgi:carboxypeptidase family protein